MILRSWRGATRLEDGDRYLAYLEETGVRACRETAGNRGVRILRREVDGRAAFLFQSLWDSMDAVRAFAGPEPGRAVFYPEDERYLVERDEHVEHWEVLLDLT